MKTRLLKEFRQLLPAWVAAVSLLSVAILFRSRNISTFYLLGLVVMAIASFCREFNQRTFAGLLTQPVSREHLWWEKVSVLLCTMFFLAMIFPLAWNLFPLPYFGVFPGWGFTLLMPLLIAASGLLGSLLLRHFIGAAVFTVVVPFVITASFIIVTKKSPWGWDGGFVLGLYAIAAFFMARRLFLRAQDYHPLGSEIYLSWRRQIPSTAAMTVPDSSPLWALVKKELWLQQVNALAAVVVFPILGLVALLIRFGRASESDIARDGLRGLFLLVVGAMPVLVGALSIAEERKLGIHGAQLCLPISHRRQFFVKLLSTAIMAFLLAALLPSIIQYGTSRIGISIWGPDFQPLVGAVAAPGQTGASFWGPNFPLFPFAIYSLLASALAFYASSLSRSALQATLVAIGFAVALGFLVTAGLQGIAFTFMRGSRVPLIGSELLTIVGVPVFAVVMLWFSYANYRIQEVGSRLWFRSLRSGVIAVVLVLGLCSAIYHRCWELALPGEPAHGPARLSQSTPPKLISTINRIAVLLPDGRLWMGLRASEVISSGGISYGVPVRIAPRNSGFVPGTNWLDVALSFGGCYALRNDGSLWLLIGGGRGATTIRVGSDSDWKAIAAGPSHFLALKTNGTLWGWRNSSLSQAPVEINTETDWTAIYAGADSSMARKSDGTMWRWGMWGMMTNSRWNLQTIGPRTRWESFPTEPIIALEAAHSAGTAVFADGSVWAWGMLPALRMARSVPTVRPVVRLGNDTNWADASMTFDQLWLAAIKRDGSFWIGHASPPTASDQAALDTIFGLWSQHSDWLAVAPFDISLLALSADGNLWLWANQERPAGLLASSRRPQKLANIFE